MGLGQVDPDYPTFWHINDKITANLEHGHNTDDI